jgi:hypothetical protein
VDPTWASRVLAGTCTKCVRRNPSTSALHCLWKATRSKPGASVQASGTPFANAGEQGIRNAKCRAFGTT